LALILTLKMLLDEVFQGFFEVRAHRPFWCKGIRVYLVHNMNILDLVWLAWEIFGVTTLFRVRRQEHATIEDLGVLALWSVIRWAKTVSALRGISTFGLTYMPILRTLKSSAPMLCFTTGALCALTHAIYLLAPRSDPPNHFYSSLLLTFRLGILGDFDRFEIEGTDTIFLDTGKGNPLTLEPQDPVPTGKFWYIQVWLSATTILVQVLLLQLFVGVLGAKYDFHEESARPLFLKDRAKYIGRLHTRVGYRWYCNRVSSDLMQRHLIIYEKDEESMDATSMREVVRATARSQTAELKDEIAQLRKLLASKMTSSDTPLSV